MYCIHQKILNVHIRILLDMPFLMQYKVNDKLKKKSKKSIIVNKIIVVWDIKSIICHITYNWVNGKIYINMCFLSRETLFILYLWVEKYFLRLSILKVFPSFRNEQRHPFHMLYKKGNALYPFLISFPTKSFLICCGLMSRHVNTSCMWLHKFLTFYGCMLYTIFSGLLYNFQIFFITQKGKSVGK